jgi:hypothetical protein
MPSAWNQERVVLGPVIRPQDGEFARQLRLGGRARKRRLFRRSGVGTAPDQRLQSCDLGLQISDGLAQALGGVGEADLHAGDLDG